MQDLIITAFIYIYILRVTNQSAELESLHRVARASPQLLLRFPGTFYRCLIEVSTDSDEIDFSSNTSCLKLEPSLLRGTSAVKIDTKPRLGDTWVQVIQREVE